MALATNEEASQFQNWYNPDEFEYTPYFVDDDEGLNTFNTLEKLFSENLADLPQDVAFFRGTSSIKNFLDTGSTSSQTEEWVARDPSSGYDFREEESREDESITTLFLKELEKGRQENPSIPIERSLLRDHESFLKGLSTTSISDKL
jgi:hypothetical protein